MEEGKQLSGSDPDNAQIPLPSGGESAVGERGERLLAEVLCSFADWAVKAAQSVAERTGRLPYFPPGMGVPMPPVASRNRGVAGSGLPAPSSAVHEGQRRKMTDPNKPKKPLTSFFIWCEEMRRHSQKSLKSKELARIWSAMSDHEKAPWEEKSRQMKDQYDRNMALYRQGLYTGPTRGGAGPAAAAASSGPGMPSVYPSIKQEPMDEDEDELEDEDDYDDEGTQDNRDRGDKKRPIAEPAGGGEEDEDRKRPRHEQKDKDG